MRLPKSPGPVWCTLSITSDNWGKHYALAPRHHKGQYSDPELAFVRPELIVVISTIIVPVVADKTARDQTARCDLLLSCYRFSSRCSDRPIPLHYKTHPIRRPLSGIWGPELLEQGFGVSYNMSIPRSPKEWY